MIINEAEIVLRLLLAAVLGAAVGYERERQNQPAGLRTHVILVMGSTLAMAISINLAMQFQPMVPNGDPARLAAQVISGIGFLGAGAILRFGPNIKGLTTAASLWTMAIVGLAVGAGYYFAAIATTAMLLIALIILNTIEHRFIRPTVTTDITISADDRSGLTDDVKRVLGRHTQSITSFSIQKNLKHHRVQIKVIVKLNKETSVDRMMEELSDIPNMRGFKIV